MIDHRPEENCPGASSLSWSALHLLDPEPWQSPARRLEVAAGCGAEGLWDWVLTAREVYYSAIWKAALGLEDRDAAEVPEAWLDRIHPEDRAEVRSLLTDCLQGRDEEFEFKYRLRQEDGAYRWASCRGVVVRGATGNVSRLAGVLVDISDRQQLVRMTRRHVDPSAPPALIPDPMTCMASEGLLELVESNLIDAMQLERECQDGTVAEGTELVGRLVDGNRRVRGVVRWLLHGLLA